MSILQELEEDKKKLAELEGEEENGNIETDSTEEDAEEEASEDGADESTEEAESESDEGEDDKAESDDNNTKNDKEEKEEKLDNAGYARLRREKAAAERKRKELEAELEALRNPAPKQESAASEVSEEPDINKDPVAWLKWDKERTHSELEELKQWKEQKAQAEQQEKIYHSAVQEFTNIEREFSAGVDDYDAVSSHLVGRITDSIRVLNPSIGEEELQKQVHSQILMTASKFHQQGLNPAEELYYMAKDQLGYAPQKVEKEAPKRDLSKVASNRKRSAGMAGASGGGSAPQITLEVAANMPAHEFAKLSREEKQRLLGALD